MSQSLRASQIEESHLISNDHTDHYHSDHVMTSSIPTLTPLHVSIAPSRLHRHLHYSSLYSRLLTIEHDTFNFLTFYQTHLHPLPLFANLRAGLWYTPPNMSPAPRTTSFKSADGHYGHWCSSLRRPNLNLLPSLLIHGAVVLVDVTKAGKSFPDAFSKTIPVWCAVINVLGDLYSCQCEPPRHSDGCVHCVPLHCHPSVSDSEVAQIRALLPKFVEAWKGCEGTLQEVVPALRELRRRRMKPVRCLWVQVGDTLWRGEKAPLSELDFTPLICVSASSGEGFVEARQEETVVRGVHFPRREGFEYIQGGGDDEEGWSFGMKADVFWRFRDEVLGRGMEGIEGQVRDIAIRRDSARGRRGTGMRVWGSGVWIELFGKGIVEKAVEEFGCVVALGVDEPKNENKKEEEWKDKVLWIPLKGKNGKLEHKWAFGRALGPCLRRMRTAIVEKGENVFVCCAGKNGEWAAGTVIGWLAWHCEIMKDKDERAEYRVGMERRVEEGEVGKERVLQDMLQFSGTFPQFQISRNTLKQLNRFFTSPMPSSSVNDGIDRSAVR